MHNIASPNYIFYSFIRVVFTGTGAAIMYFVWVYCELTLLVPLIDKLTRSKYNKILACNNISNQREIAELIGFSLGKVNKLIDELIKKHYLYSDYSLTSKGRIRRSTCSLLF